jgi:putative DNA primase/helicase
LSTSEDFARRSVLEQTPAFLEALDGPTEIDANATMPDVEGAKSWPEPEPLGGQLPAVESFDPDLLPAALRPLCEDVADRMGVPLDFAAVTALVCLAGAVGRRVIIQPKKRDTAWKVTPNLWGGLVGSPGMKKSPLIHDIAAPLRSIEAEWASEYANQMEDFGWRKEEADLEKQAWREQYKQRLKKGEETPERPEIAFEEPKRRRLTVNDCTPEALHKIQSENPAGILLLRDELTGWLAQLEKAGHEGERQYYLEAWGGNQPYSADRIERGHIAAPALCLSVMGGIQPSRCRNYLADTLKDGPANDGLFQRFQLLVYPDQPTKAFYIDHPPDEGAIKRVEELLRALVALDCENPLLFRFADDAQSLFEKWLPELAGCGKTSDLCELCPSLVTE